MQLDHGFDTRQNEQLQPHVGWNPLCKPMSRASKAWTLL